MNLVRQIVDELSGDVLGKLSSLLGIDSETTESAAGAAVPSLLAGLAGLASQEDGARKLTSALGGLDQGMVGNFGQLLGGDASALAQKGGSLLGSLLGDGMLNNFSNAISRFTGLNIATTKSLLTYLAPLVLGKVAAQWRSRGGNASALTSLFSEQKKNIADAVPAGFSLPDVPGLAKFGAAARTAGRTAETASRSVASWAVPLALALVAAFLLWNYLQPRQPVNPAAAEAQADKAERTTALKPVVPEMPAVGDVAQLTDSLTGIFKSATDTFSGIKDAASAESAMPQLKELSMKLDTARAALGKLPEMGQGTIRQFVDEHFAALKDKIEAAGLIPGIRAEIKALIDEIVNKIKELSSEDGETT
jgi:hypothetical protein